MNKTEIFWQLAQTEQIPDSYRKILEQNGFEDWDTYAELTEDILKDMGDLIRYRAKRSYLQDYEHKRHG